MARFRQNLKHHLHYYWHFYVIILLLVSLIIPYLINTKVAYKKNEEITIYIASYHTNDEEIKKMILDNLSDEIVNVNILSYNINDTYFGTTLSSVAITDTDIIIIPEEYATEKIVVPYFANLNSYILDSEKAFKFNNNYYGIEIYNKNNETNKLADMIAFNTIETNHEKYYLFVNKDTVNFNSVVSTNYKDNSNYVEDVIKILLGWSYEEKKN